MSRIHRTRADARLNPGLRSELGSLRGGMLTAAEVIPLPTGFSVQSLDRPAVRLTHDESGRSHVVSFYAYGAVRKAFGELFADGMTATDAGGDRFVVKEIDGAFSVVDSLTGRSVEVPLYALRDVMDTAQVLGDGYVTAAMKLEASLAPVLELVGATATRDRYPSNDDPAYRLVDDAGEELGWLHHRRTHWAVIDFDRYGKPDPKPGDEERIPYAEKKTLEGALAYVESQVARRAPRI